MNRTRLDRLEVSNLAVVEKAAIDFGSGLNVITGETGAGKSVLMGALSLVTGGRADPGMIRDGAKEAEVEAVFGGTLIRRTITREGRSRAWVNDESVSIAELKELGSKLVDIHGPRANQQLLEEAFQRETLDAGADRGSIREAYAEAWREFVNAKSRLEELEHALGTDDEMDLLRFQTGELEAAGLTEDDESVAERHAAAAHAEEIIDGANEVTETLGGDRGAAELLIALNPRLNAMAKHLPAAAEWMAKTEELTLELQELSRTVADAVSRLDTGEESLADLDARLTVINRLKRKYKCGSVAELMSLASEKKSRLDSLEHREERLAEFRAALADAERKLVTAGSKLTAERRKTGAKLAKAVTAALRDLGFLKAEFSVELEKAEPAEHGCDRVVYMFGPNPGEAPRPLSAIASSGELARVMLALKTSWNHGSAASAAVQVFDEIDANIGGEVGLVVGGRLRAAAKNHQVLAITHLPQSAVFGERHLVVSKTVSGGRTRTGIVQVEGETRVSEIARMLGGEKLTSVVMEHARELLALGGR